MIVCSRWSSIGKEFIDLPPIADGNESTEIHQDSNEELEVDKEVDPEELVELLDKANKY